MWENWKYYYVAKKYPSKEALPGFNDFPSCLCWNLSDRFWDFEALRDALEKLRLNDSALHIEQESSTALGFGFRCGFLGLLHLEIVFERIQREFDLDIISTAPSVIYQFTLNDGTQLKVDNPARYPDPSHIEWVEEPWVKCRIMAPADYLGVIMSLGMDKRGNCVKTETIDGKRLLLTYRFPSNEIITDLTINSNRLHAAMPLLIMNLILMKRATLSNWKSMSTMNLSTPSPGT